MDNAERFLRTTRGKIWGFEAGPFVKELLRSREAAESHLTHSNPRARLGAVLILRYYWGPPIGFAELCQRLTLEDTDSKVRCAALIHLGALHYDTRDPRMGQLFAGIVQDESQPHEFRYVGYVSLYALDGCRGPEPDPRTFRIPEDVDRGLVERYLGR